MDVCGRIAVPPNAANVWMSEIELVRLFSVIAPILRAAIRAVYKSGVLQPCEVEKRIRLPNGYYAEDKGNNGEIILASLPDFLYLRKHQQNSSQYENQLSKIPRRGILQ